MSILCCAASKAPWRLDERTSSGALRLVAFASCALLIDYPSASRTCNNLRSALRRLQARACRAAEISGPDAYAFRAPVSVPAAECIELAQPWDEVYLLAVHFACHLFLAFAGFLWDSQDPWSCSARNKLRVICYCIFCIGYLGFLLSLVGVRESTPCVEVVAAQASPISFWLFLWKK